MKFHIIKNELLKVEYLPLSMLNNSITYITTIEEFRKYFYK